ncbi:MAG: TonB-dependent receptor [Pseudohongiella sp.]|nr:TonB-dependent receptor [Pseudohongiella sp.]
MEFKKLALTLAVSSAIIGSAFPQQAFPQTTSGSVQTQGQGSIAGRVINDASGDVLPGASIRLEGAGRELVASGDGSFLFNNLPAGSYTVVISYEGLEQQRVAIQVQPGSSARRDFRLANSSVLPQEILVLSRLSGFASSINMQRNAPSVRTVVSAEALGQIREGNIGDALVRLPGLSVETRAGVQRTATIRGLAPQYNTVTVNGLRMTNVDGNRDIALDSFPANMLARVDVIKAPTPDMSADAIGGTVNLVTKSAYDKVGRTFDVEVGTTYNDNRDTWNRQAGVTFGDTFGEQEQFGLLASLFYFRDHRGYDVVDTAYTVSAANSYFINRSLYYDRKETKDKVGAGLAFDYRPSDDTQLSFSGIYHYDYRDLHRRAIDYRPNPATQSNVSPTTGTSTGGRVDSIVFYREPKNVFELYTGNITHRAGDWNLEGRLAYSKATKEYPVTLQVVNSWNGVNMTYDRSNPDFPTFQVNNGVDISDPARLQFRQFDTNQVPRFEDELSIDTHAERDFGYASIPWTLKTGLRATFKDASQAQPDTVRYTGLTGATAASLAERYSNADYMSESGGRAVLIPVFPDWTQYLNLQKTSPQSFTQTAAARLFSAETMANADFTIAEDIYAGYLMADIDFNGLQILTGVRVEGTEISSEANAVTVSNGQITAINRVSDSASYTNVLPGVHARYSMIDDRLVLRSSVTKAISRPPPGDLIPSRQENAQLNQRIIGNPNLKPAESDNFDVTAEYFLPPLGVLSAGVFYKEIDNFVFSSSRIGSDGVDERSRVNGDGGKVKGLELVWMQQLSFLPGLLSGLGVEANYTWLDSQGSYPDRSADDLALVNSPKYIYNGIVSYADGPFSARVSYNRLPERLEAVGGRQALDRYNAASSVWDLAFNYTISDTTSAFLNVKNLTDTPSVQYQGSRGNPTSVVYYGRQFNAGVKMNF